jgi:hypothetical protein
MATTFHPPLGNSNHPQRIEHTRRRMYAAPRSDEDSPRTITRLGGYLVRAWAARQDAPISPNIA